MHVIHAPLPSERTTKRWRIYLSVSTPTPYPLQYNFQLLYSPRSCITKPPTWTRYVNPDAQFISYVTWTCLFVVPSFRFEPSHRPALSRTRTPIRCCTNITRPASARPLTTIECKRSDTAWKSYWKFDSRYKEIFSLSLERIYFHTFHCIIAIVIVITKFTYSFKSCMQDFIVSAVMRLK